MCANCVYFFICLRYKFLHFLLPPVQLLMRRPGVHRDLRILSFWSSQSRPPWRASHWQPYDPALLHLCRKQLSLPPFAAMRPAVTAQQGSTITSIIHSGRGRSTYASVRGLRSCFRHQALEKATANPEVFPGFAAFSPWKTNMLQQLPCVKCILYYGLKMWNFISNCVQIISKRPPGRSVL